MASAARVEAAGDPVAVAAVEAWSSLGGRVGGPVEILKRHRSPMPRYVLCLREARSDGASVIAKLCDSPKAEIEAIAQREILPALGLASLEIYARLPDGNGREWLFLEDAGETRFRPEHARDLGLSTRWLARLHAGAADHPALARLPERGPEHHLGELAAAAAALEAAGSNPALAGRERDLLERVRFRLDGLAARWGLLERACEGLPHALVHGDFVPKNARIARRRGRAVLLVFDWETAGRGLPASDLASAGLCGSERAREAWLRGVRWRWPGLLPEDALRMARLGRLFRLVSSVKWASASLRLPCVARPLAHLAGYERELGVLLDAPPGA